MHAFNHNDIKKQSCKTQQFKALWANQPHRPYVQCCRLNQETRYSLAMPFGCLLKLWSKFSCCFKNVIHIQCWKLSAPYLPHICLSHFTSCNNRNNSSLQLGSNRLKTTQNAWHGLAEFLSTKCSSANPWSIFSASLGKHWPSQPMACLRTSSYLSTLKNTQFRGMCQLELGYGITHLKCAF